MNREWFVLDHFNQPEGPYTIAEVSALLQRRDFYICKDGMPDWVLGVTEPEIQSFRSTANFYDLRKPVRELERFNSAVDGLLRLCREVRSGRYLSPAEILVLNSWIAD